MNITKMPGNGRTVNPTPAFRPESVPRRPNTRTNVASLDDARAQQQIDRESNWLLEHRIDGRTNKPKPPSIPHIYAQQLMRSGYWASLSMAGEGEVIHRWTGINWAAVCDSDGDAMAAQWVEKNVPHAAGSKQSEGCWSWSRKRLRLEKPLPKLDPMRSIVPCTDHYIEILPKGFRVLAPDPALGLTHAVKVRCNGASGSAYTPRLLPDHSMFGRFLRHAFDNAAVLALVQEHCGMTLLPRSYSRAAWWHGAAGSGKSTLAEIVEAMQGHVARLNLETLGDTFSLEPLIGANLILVDEVECERWAEGRFKTLVSGNGIGINRKHQKQLASYRSSAKWIFTSNSEPFIRDKSNGVWRRLDVVHWKHAVRPDQMNPTLVQDILEREGQLVLDWMLEGARRIVERGRVLADHEHPEEVRNAKREARHNSDQVSAWIDAERVEVKAGHWTPMQAAFNRFKAFCEERGLQPYEILTSRQFWNGMRIAGLAGGQMSNRQVDGKQTWCRELTVRGCKVDAVIRTPGAIREPIPDLPAGCEEDVPAEKPAAQCAVRPVDPVPIARAEPMMVNTASSDGGLDPLYHARASKRDACPGGIPEWPPTGVV